MYNNKNNSLFNSLKEINAGISFVLLITKIPHIDCVLGKRCVLIPGLLDPGLRFTPKLPLAASLVQAENYPNYCDVVLASNPARLVKGFE